MLLTYARCLRTQGNWVCVLTLQCSILCRKYGTSSFIFHISLGFNFLHFYFFLILVGFEDMWLGDWCFVEVRYRFNSKFVHVLWTDLIKMASTICFIQG